MKRWLKRLLITALVLGIVCATFLTVERVRGKMALNKRLRGLEAQGEKLSVKALLAPLPDPSQNMYGDLMSLSNGLTDAASLYDTSIPLERFSSPGRVVPLSGIETWESHARTNDLRSMAASFTSFKPLVPPLRAAIQKPFFDSGLEYDHGFVDFEAPSFMVINRAMRLLEYSFTLHLKATNISETEKDLQALIALTARQSPEPTVIAQMVRRASAVRALKATWQALQVPGWNEEQLAAMQNAWTPCDFVGDMGRACEMERAMTMDTFTLIRSSPAKLSSYLVDLGMVEELFNTPPPEWGLLEHFRRPLWRAAWADQDQLRALEQWQTIIEASRAAQSTPSALAPESGEGGEENVFGFSTTPLTAHEKYRFLISGGTFGVSKAHILRALTIQTHQQMAITVLALQRYHLKHERFPIELADLVPQYLPALPRDHLAAGVLRYKPLGLNDFLLYSVGENFINDGGTATPLKAATTFRSIWNGLDAVWPKADLDPEHRHVRDKKNPAKAAGGAP